MEVPTVKLGELASLVGGYLAGAADGAALAEVAISGALPLQDAAAGSLTLADSPRQLERLERSPAAAVVVSRELSDCTKPMLVVEHAHRAFQVIIRHFRPERRASVAGIDVTASIDGSATIGLGTTIGAGASVGADCVIGQRCRLHPGVRVMAGCRLGDDCELYPGTILYPDTIVGARVLVHANTVLGAFGFGYKSIDGRQERTAQLGWVELGDDVEIGAGATIDRGTYGPTRIGQGSKLDNQVHIGHNCHIGRHNLICAHVGMAGSCSTGDYVVMAGQSGMADHIRLGDHVVIGGQAGVMQDVPAGQIMFGSPAMPSKRKMQEVAVATRLPEMRREIRDLQKQLAALQLQLANLSASDQLDAA